MKVDLVFYAKLMEKAEHAEEKVDDQKKERIKALSPSLLHRLGGKKAKRDDVRKAFFDPPLSTLLDKFVQRPLQAPLLQFQPSPRLLRQERMT